MLEIHDVQEVEEARGASQVLLPKKGAVHLVQNRVVEVPSLDRWKHESWS